MYETEENAMKITKSRSYARLKTTYLLIFSTSFLTLDGKIKTVML